MKNKIGYALIALLLFTAIFIKAAEPTCSVEIVEEQYHITVESDDIRTPIATSTVDVPERTPIVHNSYFNACIVYGDDNGKSTHLPVQHALVTLWGYPSKEWSLDVNTTETGCFDAKIPSDSNFTMKAMNPRTDEWSALAGTMLSAGEGKLLSEAKQKIIPFPNTLTYEAQDGVTEHTIDGNTLTFKGDLSSNTRGMIVHVPTVAGEKYIVSMAINQPLWVWFSDGAREGSNPAKLTGDKGIDHVVELHAFTAKDEETNLYLQVQNDQMATAKNITVTIEN